MKQKKSEVITFGTALQLIIDLANCQFGPRENLFAELFRSYHDLRTETLGDYLFLTSPSTVSQLVRDLRPIPRKLYAHYTSDGGQRLHQDIDRFLQLAICTERQREAYTNSLCALVNNSANLLNADKQYILNAQACEHNPVSELWFRTFSVLLREPTVSMPAY